MSFDYRRQIRRQLEEQLTTTPLQVKLNTLRSDFPAYQDLTTWSDVLTILHDRSLPDETKDELLRPLFWARAKDGDADWNVVLTLVFWPALEAIFRSKQKWEKNHEEFWHNLYWTFLEVVNRLDVVRRPHRIGAKVYNDTLHDLYLRYKRQWEAKGWEATGKADTYEKALERTAGDGDLATDLQVEHGLRVKRFRWLRGHGVISQAEFDLLVAIEVNGQTTADYAREHKQDYQTIKKRRQRALAKIERNEKKREKVR